MKHFLQVIAFSLLMIGFFAGFSNFGIPEIQPAPPPVQEKLELGAMTPERFIALGEKLFNGKGTCVLCHNAVGGRAPLLEQSALIAGDRLADSRYQGSAADAQAYLVESLLEPSAYVVAGFGKAGSGDTISPMPSVRAGSIGLSDVEVDAIVAYLQDLAGVEVTVAIPSGAEPETSDQEMPDASPRAALASADEVLAKFACLTCHKVSGEGGELGPDLSRIGATRDAAYLRRAILDPAVEIAEGYPPIMPMTYSGEMYAGELQLLVQYLAALK
ncbi:MAG TPA: c-type cytochrome [Arenicellales bacterium]|jgi:cytochrome c oxidase subunit 2|nr:c-type cytochrome [Arenicellales bacterium]MDP7221550.1 c-type cytochrome [Arenicellales bacterium]HJP08632.1 c-type cytochrome [Arenicellales bacterium]|tara:strand:+ start:5326 stop:6144 length:819 start_codon:yes stop_codon:yes gene_type:complete